MSVVFRSAWRALRREGVRGVLRRIRRHLVRRRAYRLFLQAEAGVRAAANGSPPGELSLVEPPPLISVVMPVYNPDVRWLRRAIESVARQTYPRWELCVADDASTRIGVGELLRSWSAREPRVRVTFRPRNGHISAASNSALALARGEYVALLDHDDELSQDALAHVVRALERAPRADLVYSDEDKLDSRGRRVGPYFKPGFSPDLFLSQNLVSHLGVYRTTLLRRLGGFREGFEGSQDWDLALRFVSASQEPVLHVPRVLYHWRIVRGSAARAPEEKAYATAAAVRALQEHVDRRAPGARVVPGFPPYYRVSYPLPDPVPRLSVIVDEALTARAPHRGDAGLAVEWVTTGPGGSPAERLNAAAAVATGELLVFVGRGCRPSGSGWLRELASQALRSEVGVAGGRLVDAQGIVVHGGYLGTQAAAAPVVSAHAGCHREDPGHAGRNQLVQNFLAVSADCLAVRRRVFDDVGGFDARTFPRAYHAVDLCLRLRECGLRTVWTPHAELRTSSCSDPPSEPTEAAALGARWGGLLSNDPFFHPALRSGASDFAIDPRRAGAAPPFR